MPIDQITPTSPVGSPGSQDVLSVYYPEPSTTGIGTFRDVLGAVREVASGVSAEIGGVSLEATGGFAELIQAQIQAQMEMQTTSLISNIERSKHESKMAAIRNVRMS